MPIFFFNATATTKIYTLSLHDALPIYWGPPQAGWYDKSKAAAVMYTEFRNPLVHELAADKAAKARPIEYKESAVGKWGFVAVQDIDVLESMPTWNDQWPTLGVEDYDGGKRLKLSCAAL